MPEILPDLINFRNIYLEKVVNLLNLFLFTLYKHLFDIEILELFEVSDLNFKKAFQISKAVIVHSEKYMLFI